MYRASVAPTIEQALLQAMLNAVKTIPGAILVPTPKIELYTNVINPSGNDAYSAFTLATFHGYAAAAVTWQPVGNLLNGDQVLPASVSFAATSGGTIADNVKGYILSDGAANVYVAENFANPAVFGVPGDFLDLDFLLVLKMRPTWQSS